MKYYNIVIWGLIGYAASLIATKLEHPWFGLAILLGIALASEVLRRYLARRRTNIPNS
jgi:short subunit dehydrogenase-like uncharacterized protein